MYAELLTSVRAMARARYGSKWGADHYSYATGAVSRLYQRAREEKDRGVQADKSQCAIVLRKGSVLDQWQQDHLNLSAVNRRRKPKYTAAYSTGYDDGGSISLDKRGLTVTKGRTRNLSSSGNAQLT
jgi:hypothetical protein